MRVGVDPAVGTLCDATDRKRTTFYGLSGFEKQTF